MNSCEGLIKNKRILLLSYGIDCTELMRTARSITHDSIATYPIAEHPKKITIVM